MKPLLPWLYLHQPYPNTQVRIALHLSFWFLIGLFIFSQHYISLRDPVHLPLLLSILSIILFPIIFNYYIISLWGIPALLKRRYTDLISCLIIVYVTTTAVYHYFIPILSLEYGGAYKGLISVYADAPLFIVLSKLSVLIYNYAFSFSQLSLPIFIKISKVINTIQRQQELLKGENYSSNCRL
ncbi:hypothetical protein C5O19_25140 [Siphonobacter curvatus]|uniref:Uncharacterized protein n=1 Tax=Siphonobacter curvatus TaxID=2094562 RepID=A0A2S7IF09_9BACT|nr:hypothetical protein C5O19_25140 [Siphonobacter curvatus]